MTEIQKVFEIEGIQARIFTIRGKQVMMDRDLAELYGVETRALNKAVGRNLNRFPDRFRFQLTSDEFKGLMFHFGTSNRGGTRKMPFAFTEQGVAMLSALLRSELAVNVSIQIMDAFVEMRMMISQNAPIFQKLDFLEQKQMIMERKQLKADENFEKIFDALQSVNLKPKQGIFYDGQVFDAYTFVADLIRSAEKSIVLIDNYVDDTVLRMFAKRRNGVSLCIYTKRDSILALDLAKYKAQYGAIDVKEFKNAHDRLIIDGREVYHIGASLKDLGNKWFGFSKMEMSAVDILRRL
ncbi:ORF6N domain-containing protein [Pedobacter sp. JY14-1]|uniref:ORF6N domain-containing protein n=1 Tax=Pedobacter sp. JY14-1 TaxID=3034151 RepID=UPI0023E17A12|nr:ORF6N domain-containing protein [Pedobacter sp. JY14-1]